MDGMQYIASSITTNVFREFIFIVFYRMRLVISIFFVVSIGIGSVAILLPPVYRSSAKFTMVIPQSFDPLQKENFYDYRNRAKRFLDDQKELIRSYRVLSRVINQLYPDISNEAEVNKLVGNLVDKVQVTPPGGETFEFSNVFYIYAEGDRPEKAYNLNKAMIISYLSVYKDISKSKSDYSYEFFNQQAQRLYDEMVEKEKRLRVFETEKAVVLLEMLNMESGKTNVEVGLNVLLSEARRKYYELQQELLGIKTGIEALETQNAHSKIPIIPSEMEVYGRAITAFKSRVAALQIQLNEMKPQFKGDFMPIKQVESELDLNIKSLREELERAIAAQKITVQSITARLHDLERLIGQLEERIRANAEASSAYEQLKQELNLSRAAYAQARSQLEQARLASALNQQEQVLTLVDEPVMPIGPYKPNRPLLIILGIVMGGMLGIAFALTADHFDHTIKRPEDIQRHLAVDFLGSISRQG